MILQVSPDAPFIVHAAAASLLVLHIGGGTVGIVSGFVALAARKGGRLHRMAGAVFFPAMLIMSAIGGIVSPFVDDRLASVMGFFTFYLVASAWLTVWRKPGRVGRLEVAAMVGAAGCLVAYLWFARIGAMSPGGMIDEQSYMLGVVFGAIAALAAVCDLRMIRAGGISGASRIARHLWRMSLALFIASGSLFLGQPQVFPEALRGSPLFLALSLAPLLALIFRMIRVRIGRRFRLSPRAAA